jgi:hypothetical protein
MPHSMLFRQHGVFDGDGRLRKSASEGIGCKRGRRVGVRRL